MLVGVCQPTGDDYRLTTKGPTQAKAALREVEQYSAAGETTVRHTRGAGLGCMAHLLQRGRKGRDTPKDTPAHSAYFSALGT
jgi:hypothetical protein